MALLGICISATIYFVSSVTEYSYIEQQYNECTLFSERASLIKGSIPEDTIAFMSLNAPEIPVSIFWGNILSESGTFQVGNTIISTSPMVKGVNANFSKMPIISRIGKNLAYDTCIIAGRDFEAADMISQSNYVVISELAAKIYFGGADAKGGKMQISFDDTEKHIYTVIGVIQNTPEEDELFKKLLYGIYHSERAINIPLTFYIPASIIRSNKNLESQITHIIAITKSIEQKSKIASFFRDNNLMRVYTYESSMLAVKELCKGLNTILLLVMIVIMLISGCNIFNSMTFLIRERTSEIGLRKAMGASNADILIQFTFEGICIAMIGALISILLSSFIIIIVQIYFEFTNVSFRFFISENTIMSSLLFVVLQSTVFSIFPSLKAAKMEIVDAIRFD